MRGRRPSKKLLLSIESMDMESVFPVAAEGDRKHVPDAAGNG
jgi:hypothetical protein